MNTMKWAIVLLAVFLLAGSTGQGDVRYDETETNEHYSFRWSDPSEPYLTKLRTEFDLENLVEHSLTDLERLQKLSNWVFGLWEHHGSNQPMNSDPISIIREAAQGESFRCVEYATVLQGSLTSLGIRTRRIGLKTRNVQTSLWGAGHVAVEAYLPDIGKWVLVDPQWNVIPVFGDIPLSAMELGKLLAEQNPNLAIISLGNTSPEQFFAWIDKYLFYLDIPFDNRVGVEREIGSLMLVPQGAREPKRFQLFYPLQNMTYTKSSAAFYRQPAP